MPSETTITMPQLGESLTEGTITKWLKKVGDSVKQDEPLFEVSTDKINTEVSSEGSGTLVKIIANEGDTVPINQPIAILSESGVATVTAAPTAEAVTVAKQEAGSVAAPPAPAKAAQKATNGAGDSTAHTGLYPSDPSNMITLPSSAKPTQSSANGGDEGPTNWREKSSPLVRRILAENNLDISVLGQIKGTGAAGRVTKDDVMAFVGQRTDTTPTAQPAAAFALPQGTPSWITAPSDADSEIVPLAGIRKLIAERLSYSEHIAPHVTTFAEADVTDLVALRARNKQWVADEHKASLTFLPFVIRAICSGLRAFPGINASLIGDSLYLHKRIHIGIAVSLDQSGLILPVIKDADKLGIIELAQAVSDLAARARNNQLKPDEIKGSTFTLSNPGAFGGWISTPIINQPNAAILNTGTIKKMPWVMPDDSIVARSIMFLSLSYDHRIVDGETSVKFLQHIKGVLENVERSFLL